MTAGSDKWRAVEEKLAELRELVDRNWDKGQWDTALLGTDIIRTVERSKSNAAEMRQRARDLTRSFEKLHPDHRGDQADR
ncbi:MAG: hypothetical protein V3S10_06400 [Dehalococcoidales bacterium]